jgi:hypothetical protein
MKDRILEQLQKITAGDLNSQLTELAKELNIEISDLKNRARQTFHSILHDYSSFSVLTIDSFVQRVVTAFTDDLELPYSFELKWIPMRFCKPPFEPASGKKSGRKIIPICRKRWKSFTSTIPPTGRAGMAWPEPSPNFQKVSWATGITNSFRN